MVTRHREATRLTRCIANKGIFQSMQPKRTEGMEEEREKGEKKERRERKKRKMR